MSSAPRFNALLQDTDVNADVPSEVEFWLGKPSRLHDRVRYLRVEGSPDDAPQWQIERLSP